MFPDGSPKVSTFNIQNGNFRSCGELSAVSLAQGGHPPCFLSKCSYESLYKEPDLMSIKDSELTPNEISILNGVCANCKDFEDLIIENDYTGPIREDHAEEIANSLKVNFVSKRIMCMKEFGKGLDVYGVNAMISSNPSVFEKFFVKDFQGNLAPDANYLFSLLAPNYSEPGSSKRLREESIMDFFQDALMTIEDTLVSGHQAAVAWKYDEDDESNDNSSRDHFEKAEVSIPDIMRWLTGQSHKPINGDSMKISVDFDHECMQRNPKHTICYPLVGSCAKQIALPVAHMEDEKTFLDNFVTAYCHSQAFARH